MDIGKELQTHYGVLLGINSPWIIEDVKLETEQKTVTIKVTWPKGNKVICPSCGQKHSVYDHRKERIWRHLDTMQFSTIIKCSIPRCKCTSGKVKTIHIPWAEPERRFTLLFERFAIDVLLACKSIKAAQGLLGLSWDEVCLIMKKAVKRGKEKQILEKIQYAGIDEKSFRKGHKYISVLADLDKGSIIDIVKDRTKEATKELLEKVPKEIRDNIKAISMDMWEAYEVTTNEIMPNADRVHDKFHISGYLNKAVDQVRKSENRIFQKEGNTVLTGTKYLWMRKEWSKENKRTYKDIKNICIKTGRAWSIKEVFRDFWNYKYKGAAITFFKKWYFWATHSKLKPIIKVAKMLKRHLNELVTYFKHRITNALLESLNSRIQIIKSNARGFRNFDNFRAAILFYLGGLDLYPQETQ